VVNIVRRIIKIDEDKCNGCGLCADACHEGAIGMVNGKAKLLRDDYCDGLGDCLPVCPTGAITFEERKALPFDEQAVLKAKAENEKASSKKSEAPLPCGCPGSTSQAIKREITVKSPLPQKENVSRLSQWPVKIKLVPVNAPYFNNANLLIAADCSAFAHGDFHNKFMQNKITLIGCPKLDSIDYSIKLSEIITNNNIKSITVVRMEVPCCKGLISAVTTALKNSGKLIPWRIVVISADGKIIEET
jgi:ferredoxin